MKSPFSLKRALFICSNATNWLHRPYWVLGIEGWCIRVANFLYTSEQLLVNILQLEWRCSFLWTSKQWLIHKARWSIINKSAIRSSHKFVLRKTWSNHKSDPSKIQSCHRPLPHKQRWRKTVSTSRKNEKWQDKRKMVSSTS